MLQKLFVEIIAAEQTKLWKGSVRLAIMMSLLGLAVMTIVVGMIFVLIGLYLSLAEKMPSWEAGMVVGGGVALLAAIWLIVIAQQGRDSPLKDNNASEQASDDPTAQLGSMIGDIVAKSNVKSSDIVLATLIAGLVLGASPSLRRRILTIMTDMTKSNGK